MEKTNALKYYVIITPFFPSNTDFRGPFIYDLAKAIEKTGQYKEVLVFKPKCMTDKQSFYFYQGIKVHLFPMMNFPSLIFNGILNGINSKIFVKTLRNFNINIQEIAVAHGHTSSFGAFCLALKHYNHNITTILHHHDPDPYTIRNGKFAGNPLNLYIRASINVNLFEKIDWHVTVSNYVKTNLLAFPKSADYEVYDSYLTKLKTIQNLGIRKPSIKNVYVLYNGVDLNKFPFCENKHINDCFTIGCIGNFVDWKGQITLLKALEILIRTKQIVNIKIVFVGSGPNLNRCSMYIKSNQLSNYVEFRKELDHSTLCSLYYSFDLFCLPSYFEGFGCVFTEAASCGIPFIVCKNQGASEYINSDELDLWTIPPKDEESLAKRIFAYYTKRYEQHYKYSFDINILVHNFLNTVLH